jgi:hypothetical protein
LTPLPWVGGRHRLFSISFGGSAATVYAIILHWRRYLLPVLRGGEVGR